MEPRSRGGGRRIRPPWWQVGTMSFVHCARSRIYSAGMQIRAARPSDAGAIAAIIVPTIREGATYALDPGMSEAEALAYWMAGDREVFVAEADGAIVGTYYMRPNQGGGGRHVCNCGYMTSPAATGRGIARRMCAHSLDHARQRGYRAMQFNFVVSTNERAVRLWQGMEFEIVGRLPGAFRHPAAGFVDALVMYRTLQARPRRIGIRAPNCWTRG